VRRHPIVKVLIADDDTEIRATLRMALEDGGYTVIEATDGATALAVLESSAEPLVALLDYRMPEISGTGVVAALADDEGRLQSRHALVLLTAAHAGMLSSTTAELFPQQPVPILAKPFDVDALLQAVADAARRLPSRQE
jgi:CheY-like chemotaxis protein